MRKNRENQLPLSPSWPDHRLARELESISEILDQNPSISDLVLHDLCDKVSSKNGARGMTAEQVLRLSDQTNPPVQLSKAGFSPGRLAELSSAGFPMFHPQQIHLASSRIEASTWQALNRVLVGLKKGLEKGRKIWMPPEWKVTSAIRSIASCFTIRFGS